MRHLATFLAVTIAALMCPALVGAAQPLPTSPDPGVWTPDGPVTALATSAGTAYIGGSFNYVGPPTGAAIGVDSTGQATPLGPVSGRVTSAVADPNGGAYLAGDFMASDRDELQIVHVLPGGGLDPDFRSPELSPRGYSSPKVNAMALVGSRLYIGGKFSKVGGEPRTSLAALDAGKGDVLAFQAKLSTFHDESLEVHALALESGFLYVGGYFEKVNGVPCANLADIAPDGTLFQGICHHSPNGPVRALAVQGKTLYVGGGFTSLGASPGKNLRRFSTASDVPDATWTPQLDGPALAIAATAATVYVGGPFAWVGQAGSVVHRPGGAACSAADGQPLAWKPAPTGTISGQGEPAIESLLVAGGKVYAGGSFTAIGGHARNNLAALDATSGASSAWNPDVGGTVVALAAATGGRVVAAGSFSAAKGVIRRGLAAIGPDGRATKWNPRVDNWINAIAVSPDRGTVYVGGEFAHAGGEPRAHLAALSASDGAATSFDPGPDGPVDDLLASSDGHTLYVAGDFKTIGYSAPGTRSYLAALSTATGDPTAWRPAPDGSVRKMSRSPDGAVLYVVGNFKHIGSQPSQPARLGGAAISVGTGAATSWTAPVTDGYHLAVLASPAGTYLGGKFHTAQGQIRNGLSGVSAAGALLGWNPGFGHGTDARALAIDSAGSTIVGGYLWDGSAWRSVAEVNPVTGAVGTWKPRILGGVHALAVDGRRLWVAGTRVAGGRTGLASFTRPADPPRPGGGGTGPGAGTPDTTAPTLSAVRLRRARFRVGRAATAVTARVRAGTELRFTLDEAARVRIAVQRRRGRRYKTVGALWRNAPTGRARVPFSGRLGKRALRPARYRLTLVAMDAAGNASRPARVGFRIVR